MEGEITEVVVFCEEQFGELLEKNISQSVKVLDWIFIDHICECLEECVDRAKQYYVYGNHPFTCIMSGNRKRKETVMRLMEALGVDKNNVLDVYKTYRARFSNMYYQRIMNDLPDRELDGLVLGISHGLTGIVAEKLPGNVCNLCQSSQDIYFNYRVLRGAYENYYSKIKNLKYVIFDMFDYTYFNFDTIQTGAYEPYLEENGFLCEERSPWNKPITHEIINEQLREWWWEGRTQAEQNRLDELFPGMQKLEGCACKNEVICDKRKHILPEKEIENYKKNKSLSDIQRQVFENTLESQLSNFYNILQLLKRINPEIKIYLVLLPKYKVVEEAEEVVNQEWRKLFVNFINDFQKKIDGLELIDLKSCQFFSEKREYYFDLTHFNHRGACEFTEYLSKLLADKYGLTEEGM